MNTIKLSFDKGITKEFEKGITYYEVCENFGVQNETLAVKTNNSVSSLMEKAVKDENIEFINIKSIEGKSIYKAGLKFLFEVSLKKNFPNAEIVFDHSVPLGMHATIECDKFFTEYDLATIKNTMNEYVNKNLKIKKMTILKKEAVEFYNKRREFEKADNAANITDNVVSLYELDGYHNYFYSDMPYSTGMINKYELVYLGKNKVIFMMPHEKSNYEIPEYIHYWGIIDTFNKSKEWLLSQEMPYVTKLNLAIASNKIKDFMKANEIIFHMDILNIVNEIKAKKNVKFVMVAGPSSSGKTTTTKRISEYLKALGYNTINLSTDDYFLDRDQTPTNSNGEFDFERIDAIDLEYFNSDLQKLLNGETITLPEYNFIIGKKELSNKNVTLTEDTIILIEGLHSLNDELTSNINPSLKYKIYLSPFIPLNIDRHNYISTIDLRLLRRIVRDNRTRGYSISKTIHTWNTVRNGEEKYIFPYIHQADKIINTALNYEIGVLKAYIEPLLLSVNISSVYYAEAQRILCFLKQFFVIPGEYVDKNSILREFIGGVNND